MIEEEEERQHYKQPVKTSISLLDERQFICLIPRIMSDGTVCMAYVLKRSRAESAWNLSLYCVDLPRKVHGKVLAAHFPPP